MIDTRLKHKNPMINGGGVRRASMSGALTDGTRVGDLAVPGVVPRLSATPSENPMAWGGVWVEERGTCQGLARIG